ALLVAAFALAAVACGSAQQQTTDQTQAGDRHTGASHATSGTPATSGGDYGGSCDVRPVYFAYDSSDLDARARSTLEQNARCINQRDAASVRVVGMTDPRGTEEYNLALGDRRARSVASYMSNLGVDQSRVNVRSMGEERASGQDESGWAQDRRAEIEIQ